MSGDKKSTRRRRARPVEPTGLSPGQTTGRVPASVDELCRKIESDGGKVLAPYRDPLGGHWLVSAVLPLELVEPTPYQRRLSEAHVKRLANVIAKTDRYLDPIIAFRVESGRYQSPNGHHRASAMKQLGARSITALVVTEEQVARLILALNVEKAHNLREKCLEVIRLARHLEPLPNLREKDLTLEFEEAAFLTLGLCYEQRGRFAGSAYHPLLKRVDTFINRLLPAALLQRQDYARQLLAVDDRVTELVRGLRARGLESPYLRNLVVARIDPVRFQRSARMPMEEALGKLARAAERFDPGKIGAGDLARTAGMTVTDSG
jgi:ParB family chromosome partitioning protein